MYYIPFWHLVIVEPVIFPILDEIHVKQCTGWRIVRFSSVLF